MNTMATEVRPLPRARGEFASQLPLVERGEHRAVGVDAFVRLDEFGIQRRRQADRASEDVRPVLIADAQGVAQAAGRDEQRRIALAREQRVRRDGGAQTHAQHRAAALRIVRRKHRLDAAHGRVAGMQRIAGQDLERVQLAEWAHSHDVGEGAAAIDGEIPATRFRSWPHAITLARRNASGNESPCDTPARCLASGA